MMKQRGLGPFGSTRKVGLFKGHSTKKRMKELLLRANKREIVAKRWLEEMKQIMKGVEDGIL